MEELSKEQKKRVFNPNNIFGKDKIPPYSSKTKPYLEKTVFVPSSPSPTEISIKINEDSEVKTTITAEDQKEKFNNLINFFETFEPITQTEKKEIKKDTLVVEYEQLTFLKENKGTVYTVYIPEERDYKLKEKEFNFVATKYCKYGNQPILKFGSLELSKNNLILLLKNWDKFFS